MQARIHILQGAQEGFPTNFLPLCLPDLYESGPESGWPLDCPFYCVPVLSCMNRRRQSVAPSRMLSLTPHKRGSITRWFVTSKAEKVPRHWFAPCRLSTLPNAGRLAWLVACQCAVRRTGSPLWIAFHSVSAVLSCRTIRALESRYWNTEQAGRHASAATRELDCRTATTHASYETRDPTYT